MKASASGLIDLGPILPVRYESEGGRPVNRHPDLRDKAIPSLTNCCRRLSFLARGECYRTPTMAQDTRTVTAGRRRFRL
jgi:hypothetical protein